MAIFEEGSRKVYRQLDPDDPVNAAWSHRNGRLCTVLGVEDISGMIQVKFDGEIQAVYAQPRHLHDPVVEP